MAFGMDSTGFTKKDLTDIKLGLEEELTAIFGPINSGPEAVFGQTVGVISEALSEVWDLAEDVYFSQYPVSANGVPLDNAVDLTGIKRLDASSSFVTCVCEGDEGTIIPIGSQGKQAETNELFENDVAITITKSNVLRINLTVNDVQDSTVYSATIGGTLNSINSGGGATESSILLALQTEIDTNMLSHTTEMNDDNTELTVYITDKETSFTADQSAKLDMARWTPGLFFSLNKGSIPVPGNTVTAIETPVAGWGQIDNLLSGETGRDVETDDELRIRRRQSLRVSGAATVPAIEARIFQEVDGVTSVVVKENRTDFTDSEGRPPHSFEAIVSGGLDQDIGDKIWEVKPAGIQTYADLGNGGVEVDVTDSQGEIQKIRFSRPVEKYAHIQLTISLYPEETFPGDGVNGVKSALATFGNSLNSGEDLIVQRFFTPVYTVPGIQDIQSFEFGITKESSDSVVEISSGTNDSTSANKLIDSGGTFVTDDVVSGMIVENETDGTFSAITKVVSETELELSADIFLSNGKTYGVGKFAQINVPLASNEIGKFDTDRIDVTIA